MYGLPYAFSHIIQTHAAEGILEDKLHPGKLANRVSACHECQPLFLGICCSLAGNRVLRLTVCLPLNLSTRWIGAWELSQCCQVMPCLFTHTHTHFLHLSTNDFHPERAKHDSLEEVGPEDRQDLNRCQHMAMWPPLNTTEFAVQNARSCRRYDI